VEAEPLSKEAFVPFGEVIGVSLEGGASANQGTALRFDWLAQFENTRIDAKPNLAVFRSIAKSSPFAVKLLERHPCSTQLFVALKAARFLVIVAPDAPNGTPDLAKLRAFIGHPGQGINYKCGLWHHPIVALDQEAELLMLAWEDGSKRDCEVHPLAHAIEVEC